MMSPKGKITVILADDTLIAREGWKRILETSEEIKVIGEARTTSQATKIAAELKPDVMLMDLLWFGDETAGWMAIKEIKKESPEVRIVAVTAYQNLIRDARLAGADSAMLKTFTREQLLNEIRVQSSRPNDISSNFLAPQPEIITDRERQVLELMGEGHSDKEIAQLLGIAQPTAKNHIKSILEKLNARNRVQAVSVAREMGLLQ